MLRLARAEYWLLESVVSYALPLSYLLDPDLEERLNKTGHGLDEQPLLDVLEGMLRNDWIRIKKAFDDSESSWVPTRLELLGAICREVPRWDYSLSPTGGAAWESFAAPRWERFLDQGWSWPEEDGCGEGEVRGTDEGRVSRFLSVVHHVGYRIREGTEVWRSVQPFQATYWKQLPGGFEVQFKFDDLPPKYQTDRADVYYLQKKWYAW